MSVLYYWVVSKYSFYYLMLGWIMSILGAIGSFYLPESPVYLIAKGRTDEAAKVMQHIARVNRRSDELDAALKTCRFEQG